MNKEYGPTKVQKLHQITQTNAKAIVFITTYPFFN